MFEHFKKFLIFFFLWFEVCGYIFPLDLSKPNVLFDKSNNSLLIMLFVEGDIPQDLELLIKRNIDLEIVFNVKLVRKDFGLLNVQTEITNIVYFYKVSYDFFLNRITVYNYSSFRVVNGIHELFDKISPLLIKIKLDDLKDNPDFSQIYPDTRFFVTAELSIVYMRLKPPLSLIASLLGMGNVYTPIVYSDEFYLR